MQSKLIADEEEALKSEILRLHECDDTLFAANILEALDEKLEVSTEFSNKENGGSITRTLQWPEEVDASVFKLVESVSELADIYIAEKRKVAVLEIEEAMLEMVSSVDSEGDKALKLRLNEIRRYEAFIMPSFCSYFVFLQTANQRRSGD
jgi:hypothetical protein